MGIRRVASIEWLCLGKRAASKIHAVAAASASIAVAGCIGTGTVDIDQYDGRTGTVEIEPTDLSFVDVGAKRKTVEQALGEPVEIHVSRGITVAVYQYDRGGMRAYSLGHMEAMVNDPSELWLVPLAMPLAHAMARPIEKYKLRKTQRAWLCLTYLDGQYVAEMKRILEEEALPDCRPPAYIPAGLPRDPH